MIHKFRALPLRSRLALLVAVAVAVAVAAVSTTCWFVVRGKLYDEVDSKLKSASGPVRSSDLAVALRSCSQTPDSQADFGGPKADYYFQLVRTADDKPCVFANSVGTVQVDSSDQDVARRADPAVWTFRNGTDTDGRDVRVLTGAAVAAVAQGPGGGVVADTALLIGYPLKETEGTLNDLALLLLIVSGIGVLGAGAAGLWIARAGLKPVDRLTGAVEHVARTEDLTVRIPVEGEDEIARLSRSFNSMTAALASSRERQAQLIADAGHELRTPLTSLRTNIELLARSEETGRALPPADRTALMASVTAQMTELALLIGDLQELSRPDAVQSGPLKVVAFHDVAEAALRRARLRGPELAITADLRPWYVRAEQTALERAIVNVLDNAVKFSPPGGTVEVSLRDGELSVRDRGPGIPADELPHVFERFWRSPSARALPGSGLGLSIVVRTVQQSGGEIELKPATGGGTRAVIRLPGAAEPPPAHI
ncbi:HAMP domain-containing histidine kinase [Streptomyces lunaelactis]|uniref:HAMP domain-containing sensor histidine kinase n=1 Tax=Streptomyces lunaelactis TaxID=1535768 RepID=UPI0015856944|nr:HAMP domain-containing sensor histidine kinase [Streptomyces lunaelactis]NUK12447.1 HAMP domain-containing histidine kinase [Streptomyces lunaelactis]NUL12936.1 HAMP domain-containing histidine kinase [Streptomyces lunaelactis]NUL25656.1 HAMP domain-containing histidine kinase [Streptomyces lunaelactis]